jgi:hypothetical protein
MRAGVSTRVAAEELQLQEALKHIQELQDLLSEEEASQREWRTYAESKNVEALAAVSPARTSRHHHTLSRASHPWCHPWCHGTLSAGVGVRNPAAPFVDGSNGSVEAGAGLDGGLHLQPGIRQCHAEELR